MALSNNTLPGLLFLLGQLGHHISGRRRRQFVLLLSLTALSSLAEVVSLGAVLPFIGILTQPDVVFASPWIGNFVRTMGYTSGADLVLPLTIGFAVAALVAGGLRILLLWVSIRLGNATGADLSIEIYRRTLYQPYDVHLARNSSEIISGITQKVSATTGVLISGVTVVTSSILFVVIMITLLAIDPLVATIAALSFGFAYVIIARFTRRRLIHNSQSIARNQTQVVKSLQEGLGAIRDVLLDGTQEIFSNAYRKAILQLQRANGENKFMSQAPRFLMEAWGMVLVGVFVLVLSGRAGGVVAALPVLAAVALGAQRLLPLMQQLYGNWSVVAGSKGALVDVLSLLSQPLPPETGQSKPNSLKLKDSIQIENLFFRYESEGPWVLENITLSIPKGARIGFVGTTGSGKSTALDLVMGLLEPSKGKILVDGQPLSSETRRAWQQSIAHVPQSIYLADTTITENIAFGVPLEQIDIERVRTVARQAKVAEFIESRVEGYATVIGERGIRISGGQRQRIGIARALYKQATVLIFDEATSALDSVTEHALMSAIENLNSDLTILIIAHRLTTLSQCDTIIELEHGRITAQGDYEMFARDKSVLSR